VLSEQRTRTDFEQAFGCGIGEDHRKAFVSSTTAVASSSSPA
jgi:hypothetical protein